MEDENLEKKYNLTFQQRIWILTQLIDNTKVNSVIQNWPFKPKSPSVSTVYDFIKKVKETGSVEDKIVKCGVITVNTKQNGDMIVKYVEK